MPQVPDYLSLVKQDKEERESSARIAGIQSQGRTPESEAKAFNLSTLTGQPVGVVRNDIDYHEQARRLDDWSKLAVDAPTLTEWAKRNDATGLVSGDLVPLSGFEKAFRSFTDTVFRSPFEGVTQAVGGGLSGFAEVARSADALGAPNIIPIQGAADFLLREFGTSSRELQARAFETAGAAIEGAGKDLGVPEERRNFATEVGSAIGQILGYVGVGAVTGGTGVALLGAGQGAEMQADRVDEKGGDDLQRAQAVALGASVTAITERVGFGWLMRSLPDGVQTQLSKRLGDILLSSGGEAVQEAVENIGHAAVEKLIYNPDAKLFDWSQIAQESGVAGVAAAIFRTALGIKRTRAMPAAEEEGKAQLDTLVALANSTKLKTLSPSKFAEMVKSLGESSISIPAEQAATLFQGATDAKIAEALNVPLDDYLTALATQGEVSIPLDHYLTRLSDKHEQIRPFIRVGRESLSLSEQDEDEIARERANKLAREFVGESNQSVFEDVRQMLKETGKFQDSDIDAYAKVVQAGFRALGAQAGMSADELYQQYRLTIKARLPDALTSPNIQPQIDSLIDRVKRGEEITLPDDPTPEQAQLKYALDTLRTEINQRGIDLQKRTPEIRDLLLSDSALGEVLNQSETAKAQINIAPGKFEIDLFQNADLSSFLHESGHMFLEIMADLAKTSPEVDADFQKALAWMGVKGDWRAMTLEQKRAHHEQFARGFEAYLFEGKAPSTELNGIFARFRRWMMAIYRQAKALNVTLNDDIRGVFDRMLATQEEIDAMRSTMRADPIVADGAALGWSPERFASYVKALREAQDAEESAILSRSLKEVEREKRAWWKEEFSTVLKQVEADMRARPEWQALEGIKGGEKLDKAWLVNRYGQGFLTANMKKLYEADGIDPDVVADKYGYDSGDAMVQAIVNLKPFNEVAKAEAQHRMEAEHGNMMTDGRIVQEAAKALHNNKRLGVFHVELDALSKLAGEPSMTQKETRAAATMIVSRQRIRDLNPYALLRAERKAANEALKFAGQQKWAQALMAKKRQVLNAHLYDETVKAQDRAEKMRRFIKKFEKESIRARLGKVGMLDQVEALLSQYDLRRVSNAKLDRVKAMQQMQLLAENGGILIEEELLVRLSQDASRVTNWRELTVEQFAGLDDVLRQIDRQARNDHTMLVNGEKKVIDDIADEIGQSIEVNAPKGGMISRGQPNAKESAFSTARLWWNSWRRPGSIARILDGKEWGPITRHIMSTMREAVVTKLEPMRRAAAEKIASIYQAHYTDAEMKAMSKRTFIPELGVSLSKFDLISLGQNWGNASNRKAVVDSSVFGEVEATEEKYAAALKNHLDAKDWAFIQDTWDYIDSFWPETRAALQRRKGIVPPKIEPEAFQIQTKDGQTITVRGGYFPLKYDTRLEGRLRPGQVETDADEMFRKISAGTSVASTTKYGHAIERVGSGGRPVTLSINTWHSHIDNVVRDLSLSDTVLFIDKILKREQVQTAFKKSGNREALETLNLWLQDVAVGEIPPVGFEQISAMLRTNFTLAKIGFNLNTMILQVTGLPQSLVVVGKKAMWSGLKKYSSGPVSAVQSAMDQSAFMAARYELNTFNKDIVQVAEYLNGRNTDTGDGIAGAMIAVARKLRISPRLASWAFAGIRITQMQVDTITWHAAYSKGIAKLNHEQAVKYADSVVENAQTSGLFMDRAGLERGTTAAHRRQVELIKIWTTLGSYMLAKGNIAAEKVQSAKGVKGAMSASIDVMLLFLPEAILYALIKGQWPDEEDDEPVAWWLTKTAAEQAAATMPFVREAPSAIKGFGSGGPLGAAANDIGRLYKQTEQGEVDLAAIKAYVNMFGTLTGLPSAQINRTIDYAYRTADGEETNPIEIVAGRQAK